MIVPIITAVYFIAPLIIIFLFIRYKTVRKIGTVIMAYAVGIIMALFGWVPLGESADAALMTSIQSTIMSVTVPLAIPLMLFNSDFRLWTKSLPKTFIVLVGGIISIFIAVIAAFFLFRNSGIPEIADVAAMMTGIYTGGTMNFYALGSALKVDPNTIILAYTFEVLITFPFILFLVAGGYKLFRKLLPFPDEATSVTADIHKEMGADSFENYGSMFAKKNFFKMLLGLLLSIGMLGIGVGLSLLITGKLNELVIILTITTLAIIASFSKKVRDLPKTFELGMFFILIFSVVVASQFNIYSISAGSVSMLLFIAFILIVTTTIHLIISRIFKVNGDLFVVGQVGMLCSPPFIPPVVGAMGNKKVLISGIVIGLVGYAVGTYLGLLLSFVLNLF